MRNYKLLLLRKNCDCEASKKKVKALMREWREYDINQSAKSSNVIQPISVQTTINTSVISNKNEKNIGQVFHLNCVASCMLGASLQGSAEQHFLVVNGDWSWSISWSLLVPQNEAFKEYTEDSSICSKI